MNAKNRGFKIFEAAIIAAVIGSVGAMVLPPLTRASNEDSLVLMVGMLHQIRCQLDLYRAQHEGNMPPVHNSALFVKALTIKGADGYGPYMEECPINPFNSLATIRLSPEADEGAENHGWHFNTTTGEFRADDSKAHSQL